jgi:hypothetical protein
LTDVEDQKTTVIAALQRLAQSGLGRVFITGGATSGEILKYVSLYDLLTIGTPVASFNDQFIDMKAVRQAFKRVRSVTTTVYPQSKDASAVVLFTLTEEISMAAGVSVEFVGFFRDPNGSSSRSIAAVDVITPAVSTDYKLSTVAGSGSGDLNANISIDTFDVGSRAAYIKISNIGGTLGYLQLQFRGYGLYPYDSISYTAQNAAIKEGEGTSLNYDLPYHSNYYTAKEIADNLLIWYQIEATDVPSLDFTPTLDDDSFSKLLVCKPGEQIALSESVTGIAYTMIIIGRELKIWNGGNFITERLFIMPAQQIDQGLFMELDVTGQSELDGAATLIAFG